MKLCSQIFLISCWVATCRSNPTVNLLSAGNHQVRNSLTSEGQRLLERWKNETRRITEIYANSLPRGGFSRNRVRTVDINEAIKNLTRQFTRENLGLVFPGYGDDYTSFRRGRLIGASQSQCEINYVAPKLLEMYGNRTIWLSTSVVFNLLPSNGQSADEQTLQLNCTMLNKLASFADQYKAKFNNELLKIMRVFQNSESSSEQTPANDHAHGHAIDFDCRLQGREMESCMEIIKFCWDNDGNRESKFSVAFPAEKIGCGTTGSRTVHCSFDNGK